MSTDVSASVEHAPFNCCGSCYNRLLTKTAFNVSTSFIKLTCSYWTERQSLSLAGLLGWSESVPWRLGHSFVKTFQISPGLYLLLPAAISTIFQATLQFQLSFTGAENIGTKLFSCVLTIWSAGSSLISNLLVQLSTFATVSVIWYGHQLVVPTVTYLGTRMLRRGKKHFPTCSSDPMVDKNQIDIN